MSTFFFDDSDEYNNNLARQVQKNNNNNKQRKAESFEVSNTLLPYQPTNAIDPTQEYQYNKYIRETQYQGQPEPKIIDPATGQPVIIASRDFQVSLIGEDGPDEYLSTARAADRLTTIWEDASDIRYKLDQQYYTGAGGGYRPIEFGVPKYTGDFGYPVIDPNPGNCKPGFLKDQFGRCLHMSWFNLPYAPAAGSPWVDTSGNSIIQNGMYPVNGVCPPEMFLASNNKCYFYPSPPQTLPPPPVSGVPISGSTSSYAGAFYGDVEGTGRKALYGKSSTGRIYNTPPLNLAQAFQAGVNVVDVEYDSDARISQVYVEKQRVSRGDRVVLHTTVSLLGTLGGYHLGIVVPDLDFQMSTPEIPSDRPGSTEEIESNFLVPENAQPGEYRGELQLVRGSMKLDSVNFVLEVE